MNPESLFEWHDVLLVNRRTGQILGRIVEDTRFKGYFFDNLLPVNPQEYFRTVRYFMTVDSAKADATVSSGWGKQ